MYKVFKIIVKGENIQIINNNLNIIYKCKIKTKNGFIISLQTKNELNNINYDLIHQHLGHHGKKTTLKSSNMIVETI